MYQCMVTSSCHHSLSLRQFDAKKAINQRGGILLPISKVKLVLKIEEEVIST